MSDQKHGEDELFNATKADDSSDDSVSTTAEGELFESVSKDEESKNLDSAEKARQTFKEAAILDIKAGKKTLEDYKDKPWLQKMVLDEFNAEKKEQETLAEQKARDLAARLVEEELTKREAKSRFEALKGKLNAANTTKQQREAITKDFDRFKGKLGAYEALETAIKLTGVDLDESTLEARRMISVPSLGGGVIDQDITQKVLNQSRLSEEEVQKLAKAKSKMYRGR